MADFFSETKECPVARKLILSIHRTLTTTHAEQTL